MNFELMKIPQQNNPKSIPMTDFKHQDSSHPSVCSSCYASNATFDTKDKTLHYNRWTNLELMLTLYSTIVSILCYHLSCQMDAHSAHTHTFSSNDNWVQSQVIGLGNFPRSSTKIKAIFPNGFNTASMIKQTSNTSSMVIHYMEMRSFISLSN
mmetsp:Transcript_24633/g.45908  ORF Transcript_24633/g.45908 Transcript_24633/m.45908 type:complete len:153 (-) Transcript_24633:3706-4164(-)